MHLAPELAGSYHYIEFYSGTYFFFLHGHYGVLFISSTKRCTRKARPGKQREVTVDRGRGETDQRQPDAQPTGGYLWPVPRYVLIYDKYNVCSSYIAPYAKVSSKCITYYYPWHICSIQQLVSYPGGHNLDARFRVPWLNTNLSTFAIFVYDHVLIYG